MKTYKTLLLLLSFYLLLSCSKDNSSDTSGTPIVDDTPISGQFQKRVLIEDFTGTWCGWCPRVAYAIDQELLATSKVVPVAIHQKSGSTDPFDFPAAIPLLQQIQLTGYPTGMLNRTILWSAPENNNLSQPKNLTSNNVGLGLAMNSSVSGGNINLDVKVKFASNYTNLKLVVYILEDKLHANQTNYTSYLYGSGNVNPLVNFEEDHVLRSCLTNILGDAITDTTVSGQTITKNFSIPVPANVTNITNMNFVAFVIGSDNKAINVRLSNPGENQTFEQNP